MHTSSRVVGPRCVLSWSHQEDGRTKKVFRRQDMWIRSAGVPVKVGTNWGPGRDSHSLAPVTLSSAVIHSSLLSLNWCKIPFLDLGWPPYQLVRNDVLLTYQEDWSNEA